MMLLSAGYHLLRALRARPSNLRSFSASFPSRMRIEAVPVRDDNYAYLLIDEPSNKAAAIDVFDVPKVHEAAERLGVTIVAAITTHHHFDHSGGNEKFAASFPEATIYGGSERVKAVTKIVKDKEEFSIAENIRVRCLATPCHTQDSMSYYVTDESKQDRPGAVFTGDTLFIGGSGRFFEGSAEEMHAALSYLGTLPDETVVYVGHEYTAGNLSFAKFVDSRNEDIQRLQKLVDSNKITTGLTTIGDEKRWNVFMRLRSDAVRKAAGSDANASDNSVMEKLREMKDNFRG